VLLTQFNDRVLLGAKTQGAPIFDASMPELTDAQFAAAKSIAAYVVFASLASLKTRWSSL